jgi:3-hydroxymyristoyl/3-hydroxydecanoyl-(acyl carrier protein) dehydratase
MTEFEIEDARGEGDQRVLRARVPPELHYFGGHFPGRPIVPGVAQLIGLVLEPARQVWPDLASPSGIKRLKFLEALGPGDVIEVELRREQDKLRFEIRRDGVRCTAGAFTLSSPCAS